MAFYRVHPVTNRDLWVQQLEPLEEPNALLEAPFEQSLPKISPDGRFLAYQSDVSGEFEIYVIPFPEGEGRWPVSNDGGRLPRWDRRGDQIYFVRDNDLMAVDVDTSEEFEHGTPYKLFSGADVETDLLPGLFGFNYYFDVAPDGQRFLVVKGVGQGRSDVVLVRNWWAEFE